MTHRNLNIARLSTNYLFPEINRRKQEYLATNPPRKIISLGIGDTSEPLPTIITDAISKEAKALSTVEGYHGYGPEQGQEKVRTAIVERIYNNKVSAGDIFISDGAKCDIGRLQTLFGDNIRVALQDPSYPVYLDGSYIQGVKHIQFLSCMPQNNFWPDLHSLDRPDVIYWVCPNNPTGATSTRQQLQELVNYAKKHKSIIVFDAAYASYIRDKNLPKSIYEIPGAEDVAIELGSFSKLAGFSGIRLGWTVVPSSLLYEDGEPVKNDWKRLFSTIFNGASSLSQAGALAALTPKGWEAIIKITDYYLENAALIKKSIQDLGLECYGGDNAPYIWTRIPNMSSWDAFQFFLQEAQVVTTPGSGFGPTGEGFLRLSAFGHRADIVEAAERINLLHSVFHPC